MRFSLSAWIRNITLLTFLSQLMGQGIAQSYDESYDSPASPTNPAMDAIGSVEVIDLNEINLREAQQSWENTQKPGASDVTDSIRIDEIIEPSGEYRYSAFGKTDPFQQPTVQKTSPLRVAGTRLDEVTGDEIPMVSPLQAYPLEELEVKGVWVLRGGETRAIIMTPKKEGIVVKEGDPIAAGKILSIKRTQLKVRQYRIREDGVREFEDLELSFGVGQDQQRGTIRLNPGKDPEFVQYDEPVRRTPIAREPRAEPVTPPLLDEDIESVDDDD